MIKLFAVAAAVLSTTAIIASPAAYAAETTLSWKGLDLGTEAGQRELARRTEVAVRTACPSDIRTGSRLQDPDITACRAAVRAQIAQHLPAATTQVAFKN